MSAVDLPYPLLQGATAAAVVVTATFALPTRAASKRLPSGQIADAPAWLAFWAPTHSRVGMIAIAAVHVIAAVLVSTVAAMVHWVPVRASGFAMVNAFVFAATSEALLRANFSGASVAPIEPAVSAWRWVQEAASARAIEAAKQRVTEYAARLMDDDGRLVSEAQCLVDHYYGTSTDREGPQYNLDGAARVLLDGSHGRLTSPEANRSRDSLRRMIVTFTIDGCYATDARFATWWDLEASLPGTSRVVRRSWLLRRSPPH